MKRIKTSFYLLIFLVASFAGCKKADQFYETLQALPQIDYRVEHAYKSSYLVGDTMRVSGRLQPQNGLKIMVGGIEAPIVKTDSVPYTIATGLVFLDRVSIVIKETMIGKARQVELVSGEHRVAGAPIDVYPAVEPGAFTKSLTSATLKTFSNANNVFFHCQNGKGDVYYYAPSSRDIRHIKKDGSEEVIYDLSRSIETGSNSLVVLLLAGGVDADSKHLFFSAGVSTGGYRLCKIDLATKQLSILNRSNTVTNPYEGRVGTVNMIVTGIYPDKQGNAYLAIGMGNDALIANDGQPFMPDALAYYKVADSSVSYIFSTLGVDAGLPAGTPVVPVRSGSFFTFRISAEEGIAYFIGRNNNTISFTIEVFDLETRTNLYAFSTNNSNPGTLTFMDVAGALPRLQLLLGLGYQPEAAFGFMPMPGRKLQTLLYQYISGAVIGQGTENIASRCGFPRWVVFDFNQERTYAYAPGRFEQGGQLFQPVSSLTPRVSKEDQLLNYDEEGNLYATANGKAVLIRTQPQ
jgi:hypothetical protein